MKRFMKLMSVILVLGSVATAEDLGGNPEVSVKNSNPIDTNYCDPYLRALGYCRSVDNILENT
jgi:hypothetical protein